ncbi:L-glyceraldehyde 3-phosphate reductase [Chitinophaga oryziterrae]|uniref:L-glyceraldehyde 3-phosphate reductase n=1 Tax=Chitinophaga oryziterrae TaxID=1031224 RepID=A0A6N8J9B7_9BACT|nr:L-glyceraldehyde 3-phosphate reductase [Chitinophaga oryziterrae]MVT41875.1 L-glyceraldehyde 3-phosphate reductase [Chitinophaga oryziterrae]
MSAYVPATDRYDSMQYNRCGKSGIRLPAISLGLWHNFGSIDSFDNGQQIVRRAFDKGITHFDLANNYGPVPGSAEENFGAILKKDFNTGTLRDELIISSKAGYLMWPGPYGEWGSRKYMISSLDQSLRRLQLDYVDIFYSHRPDPNTPIEETMGALDSIVRSGKALYVGLSNYSADETRAALAVLKSLGTPCLIHQPKYSMFERWVENGLLDVLEANGVGCIPFSPLAQGLLTDRYIKGIPEGSRASKPSGFLKAAQITDETVSKIVRLNEIAQRRGQSLAQMALSWLLKDKRITTVLIGASSVAQLDNNLGALENVHYTAEELQEIESILKG